MARWRIRYVASAAAVDVVLALVVFWRWFPQARDPPYRWALAWGEEGAGPGQFRAPIGIAVAGDEIFVSDAGNNRIQVFDVEGRLKRQFGCEGEEPGCFARPMHIDAHAGRLYVAEYLNDRVQILSLVGEPLATVGASGSGPGEVDRPTDVAVDAEGNAYVVDFGNNRVQKFAPPR